MMTQKATLRTLTLALGWVRKQLPGGQPAFLPLHTASAQLASQARLPVLPVLAVCAVVPGQCLVRDMFIEVGFIKGRSFCF